MFKKLFFSFVLCLAPALGVLGCSEQLPPEISQTDQAILGGTQSTDKNLWAKHVVLIYNKANNNHCTGFLIKKNIVLTAAHCVGENSADLSLAFGVRPMDGLYIKRNVTTALPYDGYKKDQNNRNDVALLRIEGQAPQGYSPILLPPADLFVFVGLEFIATGYGRVSGKPDPNPKATYGSGYLRHVLAKIESFSSDENEFYVDQKSEKGICSGDSGGPAIVRFKNVDYAIGIASAISWTVPADLSEADKKAFLEKKNICAERSIYMNIKNYLPWINEHAAKLAQ